jgi:hypothetical protein
MRELFSMYRQGDISKDQWTNALEKYRSALNQPASPKLMDTYTKTLINTYEKLKEKEDNGIITNDELERLNKIRDVIDEI